MIRTSIQLTLFSAAVLAATSLQAQTSDEAVAAAQRQYETDIASCNTGALPAPMREACVRSAGLRLDRARGGPPADAPVTSTDGRATVITPEGSTPPASGADPVTSRDGRANVVPASGVTPPTTIR
jgi:hypothetical protein